MSIFAPDAAYRPWSEAALELRELVARRGDAPISLSAHRGAVTRLDAPEVGPLPGLDALSAAAEAAAGLRTATAGEVLWLGRPVSALRRRARAAARRDAVGFLPEEPALIGRLTAFENVLLPSVPLRGEDEEGDRLAEELLESFELGERMHDRAASLEPAEAALVAVARALVLEPQILVAIRPRPEIARILEARAARGLAVLLVPAAVLPAGPAAAADVAPVP